MAKAKSRGDNLATGEEVIEQLQKVYKAVEKGFDDQRERADDIKENWSMYRCELGNKQLFTGRNQLYAPLVYDAVRARATRFTNQLFPQNGRHLECVSSDGTIPRAALAVGEHHVDRSRLREIVPALCVAGDMEGQYTVYVEWQRSKRFTTRRVEKKVQAEGLDVGKAEDMGEEEKTDTSGPVVELISDTEVCILPAVASSPDDAINQGGSVTIARRWNKYKIKQMIKQ